MELHVVVRGRVQGVGYRWFVREAARQLGLAGWVRNRPDGSVEIVADGDGAALGSLRHALEQGPPGASVATVDAADVPADQPLVRPFTIVR